MMRNTFTVQQSAQKLGIGSNTLFAWLRTHRLIDSQNIPYPRTRELGLMRVKYSKWRHTVKGERENMRPMITAKGIEHIRQRMQEEERHANA